MPTPLTLVAPASTLLAGLALVAPASAHASPSGGDGSAPVLVNAPVAPDALYLARDHGGAGLSVIDLNGFGQGTGNPVFDPLQPVTQGNSNFPNNPNLSIQGALLTPPLSPGTSTLDGGSEGVFTLTRDTALHDLHLRHGELGAVADIALGAPLDVLFNGGPPPFGCEVGVPNLCLSGGLKQPTPQLAPDGSVVPGGSPVAALTGYGNLISWAPHPNPPRLLPAPVCLTPELQGEEPTAPGGGFVNLLVPGPNVLGDPAVSLPPTSLLASAQNAFFVGPGGPAPTVAACPTYQIRQQVGHLAFVADRAAGELVVVNSNRMTVLARLAVEAPKALAMSPNLDRLAVVSARTGRLTVVDVDPTSAGFLSVIQNVTLAPGLADVVWQPDDEDLLVVNERTGELIVVSAFDLQPRLVLSTTASGVRRPFRLAATNRQLGFGLDREVWFAFVLGRNGALAVFESGPGGPGAVGSEALLAVDGLELASPRDLRLDPLAVDGAVWVAHQRPLDPTTGQPTGAAGGALTRLALSSAMSGPVPVGPTPPSNLADRQLALTPTVSIGESELTGIPTSIAFDDQLNLGALPAPTTPFSSRPALPANSKSPVRADGSATRRSRFLFAVVPDSWEGPGVVDVIELATGRRFDTSPFADGPQSIPAPGATLVVDWFRQ